MCRYRLKFERIVCCGLLIWAVTGLTGCFIAGPMADELNPFGEGAAANNQPGNRDNSAITNASGGANSEVERARHQLEVMGAYRRALPPEPVYPVVRPAEVRLMWIPDHLNRTGDLVPAHYYYLKVTNDRWEVQDAFDLDSQMRNIPPLTYVNPNPTPAESGSAAPQQSPAGIPQSYGTGTGSGSATPWVYKDVKR